MKIKEVVEECLIEDPRCREKDCKWITICVLRKLGFKIYIPYEQLNKMPPFDSIARCKRHVQHNSKFKFDDFEPEEGVTYKTQNEEGN